ncbi:thymidine phosphorylase family protein [Cocleimonas flava]|uniref:Putative thymidine phosphorylase n=1 Tax=Cocleimonas flava TaxID=634765 RepID=A0A4R1F5M0_9GAMM|nr:thymidine phosphorylase family protein [Cocleimonas flava]TCJ88730.1 thymidine phosphorylase [Cocleimonas flava]
MTTLKLRKIAIDTYKENVAYLHRDCPLYHTEGFQALNKIEIWDGDGRAPVIAVLNIVDDENIVAPDELGLCERTFRQFGVTEGESVSINHATPPASILAVHSKIAGNSLSADDYLNICKDIVANRYSKIEIAAFLVGTAESGLEREEILYLTQAMVATGETLDWEESLVVDKHCIGGIPGNRTTMIVTPIIAAHGMLMPKTSSRAITSPAGTADTMEVLANVDLPLDKLHSILRHQRAFIAWGGTAKLAPADDFFISVSRPLSLDSSSQMIASILSKKVAAGSTHLLIDIPIGPSAKVKSQSHALKLRKMFEYVGDRMGLEIDVVITDGKQPVGRGIGPVLEVRDVMQILQNDPEAPRDLREKSLQLAGRILEFDPDVRGGEGYKLACNILESGRALDKMQSIIKAQGENTEPALLGKLKHTVTALENGTVEAIDNLQMAKIARLAGSPMDKGAGVDLHKKIGDQVSQGDPLYTIYAEINADFNFAKDSSDKNNGYRIESSNQTSCQT